METKAHILHLQNKHNTDEIYSYIVDGYQTTIYYWKDREYFMLYSQKLDKAQKRPIKEIDKAKQQLKPFLVETFKF